MGDFRWLNRVRRADLVFNLCEGVNGHARFEDYVVGTLELAGVPFTGCRHWAITMAHRKHIANTLLSAAGLPVPAFALAQANKTPVRVPASGHREAGRGGRQRGHRQRRGLSPRSAPSRSGSRSCWSSSRRCWCRSTCPAASSTSGFVGKRMLPIAEIRFDGMPEGTWPIVGYAAKWIPGSPEDEGTLPVCPAEVPEELGTAHRQGGA